MPREVYGKYLNAHISRFSKDGKMKQTWKVGVDKNRKPGRPKRTRNTVMIKLIKSRNVQWNEVEGLAQDIEEVGKEYAIISLHYFKI